MALNPVSLRREYALQFYLFFLCMLTLYGRQATATEQITAGWVEEIALNGQSFRIMAKLDTGADNCSINTVNPQVYTREGQEWIKFTITNRHGNDVSIERPIVKTARIKTKNGGTQQRPVVELDICLATVRKRVLVNLVDRSHFKYQMLLGRSFLRPEFLVDSGKKLLQAPNCQ